MNTVEITLRCGDEDVFIGHLEVAPAVGDWVRLSNGKQYDVISRQIDIDLAGIESTKILTFVKEC